MVIAAINLTNVAPPRWPPRPQVLADSCARLPWLRAESSAAAARKQLQKVQMELQVLGTAGKSMEKQRFPLVNDGLIIGF